jgi:hypothetical protein
MERVRFAAGIRNSQTDAKMEPCNPSSVRIRRFASA